MIRFLLGCVAVLLSVGVMADYWQSRDELLRAKQLRFRHNQTTVGSTVPVMMLQAPDGTRVELGSPARLRLLLIYSDTCSVCTETWPAWQRLRATAKAFAHEIVHLNISNEEPLEYRMRYGIEQPYYNADPETILSYRLTYTPQTYIVGPDLKIRGIWTGRLLETDIASAETLLRSYGVSRTVNEVDR